MFMHLHTLHSLLHVVNTPSCVFETKFCSKECNMGTDIHEWTRRIALGAWVLRWPEVSQQKETSLVTDPKFPHEKLERGPIQHKNLMSLDGLKSERKTSQMLNYLKQKSAYTIFRRLAKHPQENIIPMDTPLLILRWACPGQKLEISSLPSVHNCT